MSTAAAGPEPAATADPVIRTRGLSLRAGGRRLFHGLDLDVRPGELVAILGRNGSGKTTLFRAILGLEPVATGSITVLGAAPRRGNPRIGYVPQQRIVQRHAPLLGRDLVMLGRTGTRFGLPVTRAADRHAVAAAIDAVHGHDLASRPLGELSGGQQQRLRIAQAIVHEPPILLLDEPLSSLDPAARAEITALAAAQRGRGVAVVVITHDVDDELRRADRIVELSEHGCWVGTPAEARARGIHDHPHHPDEHDHPEVPDYLDPPGVVT
ncbi:MAG TPA: metal ABC transporter ATP-binding protein [Microbacteriaceae bacterium]|nr:metal ABC transporter ATP-binding protein [Microbacteriaceae bacterium]